MMLNAIYCNLACTSCLLLCNSVSLSKGFGQLQVILIDVLRRSGAEVTVASVEDSLQVPSVISPADALSCTASACPARM